MSLLMHRKAKVKKSSMIIPSSFSLNKQLSSLFFDTLKQRFFSAVKWNVIESVLYHLVFIAHQGALYIKLGAEQYGKVGALFSFSFLCVTIFMGALDIALIGTIAEFCKSKSGFKRLLKQYILPQSLLTFAAPVLLLCIKGWGVVTEITNLSWSACLLLGFFISIEAIKKLLRHILQLMFYNKQTAFLEVAGIVGYVCLFWGASFLGITSWIHLFLIPFMLCSCISILVLAKIFYKHLQKLPDISEELTSPLRIRMVQLCAYSNQISRSIFSSNFLVPVFALSVGLMQAGIAALINYVTHTLAFFIHKICSPSVAAFFGQTTTLTDQEQKEAFLLSIKLFFCIVIFIFTLFVMYGWMNFFNLSHTTLLYVGFFLLVHTLEHLFTLYEKFFISQKKVELLSLLTITTCIIAGLCFWLFYLHSLLLAIVLVFMLRATLLILLSCVIFSSKQLPFLSLFYKNNTKSTI